MSPRSQTPLARYREHVLEAWAVWSALEVGLFEHLIEARSIDDLAVENAFDRSALGALLDCLAVTGHLRREGDRFALEPEARPFLLRASPQYIGRSLGFLAWAHELGRYPELLRSGGAVEASPEQWQRLTRGSAAYASVSIPALLEHHPELRNGPKRVLDVGCGQGDFLVALADACPDLQCLGVDPTPSVVQAARQRVGTRDRVRIESLRIEDVPGSFDVVFLNQVLHVVGPTTGEQLIVEAGKRTAPGGRLFVQELVSDGAEEMALFHFTMRLYFADAKVFTIDEIGGLLVRADLEAIEVVTVPSSTRGLVFVSGRKKS